MALSSAEKTRFARHLLLAEIGEPGQERLLAQRARTPSVAPSRSSEVAAVYASRAGLRIDETRDAEAILLDVPASAELSTVLYGRAEAECGAAIAGAFAAVEAIKRALSIGSPAELDLETLRARGPNG